MAVSALHRVNPNLKKYFILLGNVDYSMGNSVTYYKEISIQLPEVLWKNAFFLKKKSCKFLAYASDGVLSCKIEFKCQA